MKRFLGIFIIIFSILFIVVFYGSLRNGNSDSFTFNYLLEVFTNAPEVDVSWSYVDLTIYTDWNVFNFLRDFINLSISIIEFGLFIIGCIWQGLNYIFYLLQSLFSITYVVTPGAGSGGGAGGGSFGAR